MDFITAHKFCSYHRDSILKSKECGCFYCMQKFFPNEIIYWHDRDLSGVGQTAFCPKCKIDSVIGDADLEFDLPFLEKMHKHWFMG